MGTAIVLWRKFPIKPRKPKKITRTICEVLREIYHLAEEHGDTVAMQKIDEAHDMAKRMHRKLVEYKRQAHEPDLPNMGWEVAAGLVNVRSGIS